MKTQTPFLKHVTSLTVANTTNEQINTSLFAPDINGFENKYVRDDLSYIKVDYKQIQSHISRNDELITMIRLQVLNPKDDRLLFQTEGNEVISANNIHGRALNLMCIDKKNVNGMVTAEPILITDWSEKPSVTKDFYYVFTASKNCRLVISIAPHTAYKIDFFRDSSFYLTQMEDSFPLTKDIYNSLQECFNLYNKLNEIVAINNEQNIFKSINNIVNYIEKRKGNSNIVLLYNKVSEAKIILKELLEHTNNLIEKKKNIAKQEHDSKKGIGSYIKNAQKKNEKSNKIKNWDENPLKADINPLYYSKRKERGAHDKQINKPEKLIKKALNNYKGSAEKLLKKISNMSKPKKSVKIPIVKSWIKEQPKTTSVKKSVKKPTNFFKTFGKMKLTKKPTKKSGKK